VLGGDALGYHEIGGGRLAVYVVDVCGHGVASAMHSASVLNAIRSQTLPNADFGQPSQVLARLNEAFRMEDHGGMYFTLFYAVLDPGTPRFSYASAGHPPALVLAADGTIRARLATKNPPIGTMEGRSFAAAEGTFEPGDRLYAFSDGAYEYLDREGREHGYEEFELQLAASGSSRATGEPFRLYEAACAAAGTELLPDDFTMLLVEHAPASPR
jgi:sigma-B regulation protein RsbU (phosphoserine phosphatase)